METKKETLQQQSLKEEFGVSLTINDIREKEFNGARLALEQKQALANFDKFRISELNQQTSDIAFHEKYRHLQTMANLGDYREFLKEKYFQL